MQVNDFQHNGITDTLRRFLRLLEINGTFGGWKRHEAVTFAPG